MLTLFRNLLTIVLRRLMEVCSDITKANFIHDGQVICTSMSPYSYYWNVCVAFYNKVFLILRPLDEWTYQYDMNV